MNKNTILGFIAIGAIMFGFSWYQSSQLEDRVKAEQEAKTKQQIEMANKAVNLGLSVRQTEMLCKNAKKPVPEEKEPTLRVNYVAECEKALSKQLGRGVKIVNGKKKGRFELEFYGQEDLQVLLEALMTLKK